MSVLRNMQSGTKLLGEIVGIKSPENRIYVIKLNSEHFTAYSDIDFRVGDEVVLEVVEAGIQPRLKLYRAEGERVVPTAAENLLRICKLEINGENILLMNEYLAAGKPVQRDSLLNYFKEMKNKNER